MIYDLSARPDECLEIPLEPTQPYLAHHDVGVPLLGTVMSLEAMAECAVLRLGAVPAKISRVLAGEDCLVPTAKALRCQLHSGQTGLRANLTDMGRPVFSGILAFDRENAPGTEPPEAAKGPDSETIYNCFFHGPTFQVVERAWLNGGRMFARCRAGLPALTDSSAQKEVLPVRAMEFCLQTAGLLDAALHREMSVPLSIEEIRLYGTEDLSGLWACASFGAEGKDIHAYNGRGEAALSVLGYRTRPMPADGAAFERLCSSFF